MILSGNGINVEGWVIFTSKRPQYFKNAEMWENVVKECNAVILNNLSIQIFHKNSLP